MVPLLLDLSLGPPNFASGASARYQI